MPREPISRPEGHLRSAKSCLYRCDHRYLRCSSVRPLLGPKCCRPDLGVAEPGRFSSNGPWPEAAGSTGDGAWARSATGYCDPLDHSPAFAIPSTRSERLGIFLYFRPAAAWRSVRTDASLSSTHPLSVHLNCGRPTGDRITIAVSILRDSATCTTRCSRDADLRSTMALPLRFRRIIERRLCDS